MLQRHASTSSAALAARSATQLRKRWSWSQWTRLGTLLVIVGSVGVGVMHNGVPTLATAQSWSAGLGLWAPLVFVLLYAAATVSLLPMTALSAFAGTLFGVPLGSVVVWCGAMLGSTVAFLIGGGHNGAAAEPNAPDTWRGFLQRHGTWAIAAARLVPVVPLGLVNYTFAISSLRLRQYVLGTGIGIMPVTIALVALGDQATSLQSSTSLIIVTALGVVLAGSAVLARRRRRTPSPEIANDEKPPCSNERDTVGDRQHHADEASASLTCVPVPQRSWNVVVRR